MLKQLSVLLFVFFSVSCSKTAFLRYEGFKKWSHSPEGLFNYICNLGNQVKSVDGIVWIKLKSPEFSGQFAAHVSADASFNTKIELKNFLGHPVAVITLIQDRIEVVLPEGLVHQVNWDAFPIYWLNTLFLGGIPCPKKEQVRSLQASENSLIILAELVQNSNKVLEEFRFSFRQQDGILWPERLEWNKNQVQISFDNPDSKIKSPAKWEIKSTTGFFLKALWKSRNIEVSEK